MKNTTQNPKFWNGHVQLISVGKSIRLKLVKISMPYSLNQIIPNIILIQRNFELVGHWLDIVYLPPGGIL